MHSAVRARVLSTRPEIIALAEVGGWLASRSTLFEEGVMFEQDTPQVVALPIKLLVFVLIDGWHLVVESLLRGAS